MVYAGVLCLLLSACIGTVVGAVVDTTVEVVKIPFKVGGAIIDVVTPDELTESLDSQSTNASKAEASELAVKMEQESL